MVLPLTETVPSKAAQRRGSASFRNLAIKDSKGPRGDALKETLGNQHTLLDAEGLRNARILIGLCNTTKLGLRLVENEMKASELKTHPISVNVWINHLRLPLPAPTLEDLF